MTRLVYGRPAAPEEMTWRARAYLAVGSLRHLVIGLAMLIAPHTFYTPAFDALFEIAPIGFWIVTLLLGGLHLAWASLRKHGGHARTALTIAAAVSFMWAAAFGILALESSASVLAFAIFSALGLKDLIVCAQPLRSPFERLVDIYDPPIEPDPEDAGGR